MEELVLGDCCLSINLFQFSRKHKSRPDPNLPYIHSDPEAAAKKWGLPFSACRPTNFTDTQQCLSGIIVYKLEPAAQRSFSFLLVQAGFCKTQQGGLFGYRSLLLEEFEK